MDSSYSRRTPFALAFALVWSLLLVVGAFLAPVYSTSSQSASADSTTGVTTTTAVTTGSATLVGVNGYGVLVVVTIPLVATLFVAIALARGRRRIGWVVTSVLALLNVLALLSVGIFFVPTTVALIVACASAPRPLRAHPADVMPTTA